MAHGSQSELWAMYHLINTLGPNEAASPFLTEEEAERIEAMGGRVARIPVVPLEVPLSRPTPSHKGAQDQQEPAS